MTQLNLALLTGIAALFLATGATAAGIDYVCGPYSIIIEPKDRTYTSHQQTDPIETIVFVPKGITIGALDPPVGGTFHFENLVHRAGIPHPMM